MIEVKLRDFAKSPKQYTDEACRLMVKEGAIGVYMPIEEWLSAQGGGKNTEKTEVVEDLSAMEDRQLNWNELATEGSEDHKCVNCDNRSHFVMDGVWWCGDCWNSKGANSRGDRSKVVKVCEICKAENNLYEYAEDGAERVTCSGCAYKRQGKMAKGFLAKCKKL